MRRELLEFSDQLGTLFDQDRSEPHGFRKSWIIYLSDSVSVLLITLIIIWFHRFL